MASDRSVAGLWSGVYFYPDDALFNPSDIEPPVPFTAELSDISGIISGRIEEPDTYEPGSVLLAIVVGHRHNEQIDFQKQYVRGAMSHAVGYSGIISADGKEISGRWNIPGEWSGEFRMQRTATVTAKSISRKATA